MRTVLTANCITCYIPVSIAWGKGLLQSFNIGGLRQNGCHVGDYIFKWNFSYGDCLVLIKISLKLISKGLISKILTLVQIMVWHWSGERPLSEPMMTLFTDTHTVHTVCVSWLRWVNICGLVQNGCQFEGDFIQWIFLKFWLKFYWCLFLRVLLTTSQHWYR